MSCRCNNVDQPPSGPDHANEPSSNTPNPPPPTSLATLQLDLANILITNLLSRADRLRATWPPEARLHYHLAATATPQQHSTAAIPAARGAGCHHLAVLDEVEQCVEELWQVQIWCNTVQGWFADASALEGGGEQERERLWRAVAGQMAVAVERLWELGEALGRVEGWRRWWGTYLGSK